jgi:hypothetical protein
VVHELHRLAPALVLEQHHGVVVDLVEVPAHVGADPLLGPVDDLPQHQPARPQVDDLHVEAARREAELQHLAGVAGVVRPPGGQALGGGQGRIDVADRCLHGHSVQDVHHRCLLG